MPCLKNYMFQLFTRNLAKNNCRGWTIKKYWRLKKSSLNILWNRTERGKHIWEPPSAFVLYLKFPRVFLGSLSKNPNLKQNALVEHWAPCSDPEKVNWLLAHWHESRSRSRSRYPINTNCHLTTWSSVMTKLYPFFGLE